MKWISLDRHRDLMEQRGMIDRMNGVSPDSGSIQDEVKDRFGILPNFFRLAPDAPEITANLWGFAKFAYLDNPLPSLFKERLFVYLSRFCEVRYCIARHIGFLVGLGRPAGDRLSEPETVEQALRLVCRPLPRNSELQPHLDRLSALPMFLPTIPEPETADEEAVFVCAAHVFLQTPQAEISLGALRRACDGPMLQRLLTLLAFVRTAHFWTKTHPELELEDDVKALFARQQSLAEAVLNDPEASACETSRLLLDELLLMRRGERDRAEELADARLLASIVESSEDAVISKTVDGTIRSWNAAAERLFGYKAQEAIGRPVTLIIPMDRRHEEDHILSRIRAGERVEPFDTMRLRSDGQLIPVSVTISPIKNEEGRVIGASKTARDISARDEAERRLQRSEEFNRSLMDGSVDCVKVLDINGRLLHMNSPGLRVMEIEDFLPFCGRDWPDFWPEAARDQVRQAVASASAGQIFSFQAFCPTAKGTPKWWDVTVSPVRDSERGPVVRLLSVSRDITMRKEAEMILRYQSDLTRSITDNAATAILMMDDRSRCTFMNPAAEAMTGFAFEECDGRILHDLIHHHHPDGRPYPVSECPIDRALPENCEICNHEDVFVRKDGEFFPVMCNARVIYKDGKGVGTVIEVRDITEQKKTELAAQKRSQQVRRLAEAATRLSAVHDVRSILGIVTEEARGLIEAHQSVASLTVNQSWEQAISVVSLSDKYAPWRKYDRPPDGSGIYAMVCRSNKPQRMTQAELESHPFWKGFGPYAGEYPPMRGWLAAPLMGLRGDNVGLVQLSDKREGEFTEDDEGILVQLAQMASVAIDNARLVESLREADQKKSEFLSVLAHELRNPLAPIRTGLQIMKLAASDPNAVEQARAMMERQLGQMIHLINDLMDLTRISQGKITLQKTRMPLSAAIRNAIDTSRPLVEEAGHHLTLDLPEGPIFVDGDETRLSQVFANLLNNAAKYTDRGGRIRLSLEQDGDQAVVEVEDNGIGIPAPMLPKVFEIFTQVDRSLEKAQGGLGIGLNIVKRLVEMHGGTIEARSEGQGRGSRFLVRLPSAGPAAIEEVKASASSEPAHPAARRRVLVADDNRDGAASLAMILDVMGNETRTAFDGLEAIAVAVEFRPDVILMDIGMPKLNGYDACNRIRREPWGRDVMIIACTGWGQEEDKRKSRDVGFDQHLTKPVDPSALAAIFAELGKPD